MPDPTGLQTEHMSDVDPRYQPWRLAWRLPLFLLHVLVGIPLTLLCFLPGLSRLPAGGMSLRHRAHNTWKRLLLRVFGIRMRVVGQLPPGPVLVVANHISWLDIVLLHALWPMWLVAKAEIRGWPLIGALARLAGTIFIQRGSTDSRRRVARRMTALMRRGDRVGIFPEGGIRIQRGVKHFHPPLFQAAIRANVPVVPVAIRYHRDVDLHDAIVFGPGENFVANLFRVMMLAPFEGQLIIDEPVHYAGDGRRNLARAAHRAVSEAYHA